MCEEENINDDMKRQENNSLQGYGSLYLLVTKELRVHKSEPGKLFLVDSGKHTLINRCYTWLFSCKVLIKVSNVFLVTLLTKLSQNPKKSEKLGAEHKKRPNAG